MSFILFGKFLPSEHIQLFTLSTVIYLLIREQYVQNAGIRCPGDDQNIFQSSYVKNIMLQDICKMFYVPFVDK